MFTRPENLPKVKPYTEQEVMLFINQSAESGTKVAAFRTARLTEDIIKDLKRSGYTVREISNGWTEVLWYGS